MGSGFLIYGANGDFFEEALRIDPDAAAARRNLDMLRGQ